MLNIFKASSNTAKPRVADVGILDHYEFDANLTWSEVERYTLDAIRSAIIPYIGMPLYESIAAKVNNSTALSPEQTELLFLLRRATAYYAATIMIPLKVTTTAAAGMVNTNSEHVSPSSLSQVKFSLWQVTRQADRHLDLLLEFLEKQVALDNDYFDLWKTSSAYKRGSTPFFRRTQDFQDYFNIFTSRATFLALVPHISDICEDVIEPVLCSDLFMQLATQITADDVTESNQRLLYHLRRAIAPLAIAKATPYLAIVPEADGFKIVSNTEGMDKRESATRQYQATIAALVERCRADGDDRLNKLRKFLADNIADYPLYADSKCYKSAQARTKNFGVNVITDDGVGAYVFKKR